MNRVNRATFRFAALVCSALSIGVGAAAADEWWAANDPAKVQRIGEWEWTSHRYAAESALVTNADGAAIDFSYSGRAVVLGLDTLTPPNHYGPPPLGLLEIAIDGGRARIVRPRVEDREVVLFRSLQVETHRVRIVHRRDESGVGCRIRGIRVSIEPTGDLAAVISGEHNDALIDVRAILKRDGQMIRNTLVRNWLTGQVRLGGLPAGSGYTLEVRAAGWKTWRGERITISAGEETRLAPIYLIREWDVPADDFKFPALGRPVVSLPGGSFRARFEANGATILAVRITRQQGPATISRRGVFNEDKAAAFYYHREGTITLPDDSPPGVYDLEVTVREEKQTRVLVSRRCVVVVKQFPAEPVFFSFGHLDTWGEHQAEYLSRLLEVANILAPDMVLSSTEANPAYAAGALYGLELPFVINFGNHRGPEPGPWFGDPVGVVDFGSELTVLNFGRAWDTDVAEADKFLSARQATRTKVINAFESNAPVADFLDRHGISLIHYAHGPGPAVATMGATPTVRVGKVNSESFRIIRFQDHRPISYTYRGHATAPIPFPRERRPPIRVEYLPANDGRHRQITARVENDLEEAFPRARVVVVLPRGTYRATGGVIEYAVGSDDAEFSVVEVRFDLLAKSSAVITVQP